MKVNDDKLKGTSFHLSETWQKKKALLEDEKCQIASELRIWSIGYEDRIRIQLVRSDGTKTGIFGMTPEQFHERSPNEFIQDMWALSDTDELSVDQSYSTYNNLSRETQDSIMKRLEEREANQPCPRCDRSKFVLLDGYLNHPLNARSNVGGGGGIGVPLIPTIGLACTHCGYLVMHTVGILDLKED